MNEVVTICETFYSADDILDAKRLFFDSIGDKHDGLRFSSRRGDNAAKANMEDLVNAINKCDNDGISFPTFVSSDFSKIPQNNDGSIGLNQLMYMIIEMKTQITNLEKKCATSASTPIATPTEAPTENSSSTRNDDSSSIRNDNSSSETATIPSLPTLAQKVLASLTPSTSSLNESVPAAPPLVTQKDLADALQTALPKGREKENGQTASTENKGKKYEKRLNQTAESRVKSNFSRNKNLVIGKKPSSGVMSWTGANLTVESYIGRVDFSVTADVIKSDLIDRGMNVISIEENETRHGLYKSFRLVVKKSDFDTLNSPDSWPEGVVFRRFRRPRPNAQGHVDSPIS